MRPNDSRIFAAAESADAAFVSKWIADGGDPDLKNAHGESLLYLATGPHGSTEVMAVLLNAGANPDNGCGSYTPLMNIASWCDVDGVELLLKYGADPHKTTSDGKTAFDVVGQSGGVERKIKAIILQAMREKSR